MDNINVCYLHKQDTNKWQWFIADIYGRAIVKCTEEFNNYEEASKDYEHHGDEFKARLVIV
jgi:hypothetical protein